MPSFAGLIAHATSNVSDDATAPSSSGSRLRRARRPMAADAKRSKRCKSLLMLSAPFSSSSVKSSLLSLLLHPSSSSSQHELNRAHDEHFVDNTATMQHLDAADELARSVAKDAAAAQAANELASPTSASTSLKKQQQQQRNNQSNKCIKMKLFEQPLDKLCSSKALKQLNAAMCASAASTGQHLLLSRHTSDASHLTGGGGSSQTLSSTSKRKRNATCLPFAPTYSASNLRTFGAATSIDDNNNNNSQNNNSMTTTTQQKHKHLSQFERHELALAVLPAPIRALLSELYVRGPRTVGIFRRSPNARHCRELKQQLECDSTGSIEHYQVTVIASAFKVSLFARCIARASMEQLLCVRACVYLI